MRRLYILGAAAVATAAFALPILGAAPPAAAALACSPAEPLPVLEALPWAQRWLQPERTAPLSLGDGVTVAVLDTGVDLTHPQLRGARVAEGWDLITGTAGATDCNSHGTAVASIIGATRVDGVGFAGWAPRARILPVRISDASSGGPEGGESETAVDPARFAAGIRWATDNGARVINASVFFLQNHAVIADAVRYAISKEVIVVASAGNHHRDGVTADAVPYPAAYPGVVGVGAIGPGGVRVSTSYVGPYVDIVAPGDEVTAATRVSGHRLWRGTSFAAPFVSATIALIMAGPEKPTGAAAVARLLATADPVGAPAEYGHGMVNPYRAVTERATTDSPDAPGGLPYAGEDEAARQRAVRWDAAGTLAAVVAVGAVAVSTLALVTVGAWARGRARRWRPRRREAPVAAADQSTVDESTTRFYTVPRP